MLMDLNTSEQNLTAGSVLMPEPVDLQKFMFSDIPLNNLHVSSSLTIDGRPHVIDNLFQSL